jgi:putative MATE family efflux protein
MSESAAAAAAESLPPPSTIALPPEAAGADGGLWDSILEGLRGSHRDFTQGSVSRAILVLAIPMVLEMVMESVFAVCDVFFVSKLGAAAVATVGLTESWLTLIYAIALGLAIAATATVARRIGERAREGAARAATQAIMLSVVFAAIIGVAGVILAPHALSLMGASSDVIAQGTGYARIMLGGNITIVMLFLINAIFRGAGDAAIAMRVLWLANAINIVLGPCLIFGLGPFPKLGVAGAAIATNIGRGTGALFAFSRLLKPGSRIDIHLRHLRVEPAILKRLAQLAWSAAGQFLIGMGSWIAYVRILSSFGSSVIAGYTIGVRVILFALLPASGLANAAATMVGQALGAKKPERAEAAVWKTARYNAIFLAVIGLAFVLFARPIVGGFTHDASVARYGIMALRTVAYGFVFYAYGMVIGNSFNGAGDTRTPTWINLCVFWLLEIPLAWVLSHQTGLGVLGVFVAMTIAFSTLAVVSSLVFRKGKWKGQVV